MILATQKRIRQCMTACRWAREIEPPIDMKNRLATPAIVAILAFFTGLPSIAGSQAMPYTEDRYDTPTSAPWDRSDSGYLRPEQKTKLNDYVFDAIGPYPIVGAGIAAGINQISDTPPEWNQGFEGYAKRFASDFAIAAIGTTARYGLAQAFKEDTLYYRCECTGALQRMGHAVLSTLTARRGEDGRRVFSFPALAAPYAGSMAAVYGWYPNRFGAKDAFRIGNYSLLAYAGADISLEFFYSGPHSLLHRIHLNNAHGSPVQGPNK